MIPTNPGARGVQTLALSAAAAAVWYLAARSLHVSLSQAHAELNGNLGEITAHEVAYRNGAGDPARSMIDLAEREKLVRELSKISGDPAKVYEALGVIAGSCNIRIERVEPLRTGNREARPSRAPFKAGSIIINAESTHYIIEAVGAYADIARFAQAIERDLGLSRVVSFKLAPAPVTPGVPPAIAATIETAHYKLTETDPTKKTEPPQ